MLHGLIHSVELHLVLGVPYTVVGTVVHIKVLVRALSHYLLR